MKDNFFDDNDRMQDILSMTIHEYFDILNELNEDEQTKLQNTLEEYQYLMAQPLDEEFYKEVALKYVNPIPSEYLREVDNGVIYGFYGYQDEDEHYENYEDFIKNSYILRNIEENINDVGVDSSGTWDFYLTPLELSRLGFDVPKKKHIKDLNDDYEM